MIKISCSKLELVRKNPSAYGEVLAAGSENKGGNAGMIGDWKRIVKKVNEGKIDLSAGIKELQSAYYIKYSSTDKNKSRQDKLVEQFSSHCREFSKMKFTLVDGHRLMKWQIHPEVSLSGFTPLVVQNSKGYFSYIITEQPIDWQQELRFPLFQNYLADVTVNCGSTNLNVGTYCISSNSFDFRNYDEGELKDAVQETKKIFGSVYDSYSRSKK